MIEPVRFRDKDWRPRLRISGFSAAKRHGTEVPLDPNLIGELGMEVYILLAWVAWLSVDPTTSKEDFLDSMLGVSNEEEERIIELVAADFIRFGEEAARNFQPPKGEGSEPGKPEST